MKDYRSRSDNTRNNLSNRYIFRKTKPTHMIIIVMMVYRWLQICCCFSVGRHSKSLNTDKFLCGYCKGKFELITNAAPMTPGSAVGSGAPKTPRTPNKFAMFVKENYNTVKQKNKDLKHGDVMKELSKLFAASKISS